MYIDDEDDDRRRGVKMREQWLEVSGVVSVDVV